MTFEEALEKLPNFHRNSLQRNLCTCNEIPKEVVVKAIAEGARSVTDVREKTFATGGNGCCRIQVEFLLKYIYPEDFVD